MITDVKYGPYSPSRLDTARCPLSFYCQYVDPSRDTSRGVGSLAQERGSALHEILEKVTQRMCADPKAAFSSEEVRAWTVEAIGKYPAAYEETALILDMTKRYIDHPPKMLTTDAQTELRLAVRWDPGAGKFVECGYDDPRALARGRADIFMVSDDLTVGYIIDHKTQPNIEEADTFQMGFYAWVISKIHPYLAEVRTVLHFSRYGCYSQEYTWTKEMLQDVENDILARIEIIENRWVDGETLANTDVNELFPAIPNDHCQYCPRVAECPALAKFLTRDEDGRISVKMSNFKVLGDPNKAVEVAGLIHIMEEAKKTLTKELREHVKNSGPVAIPGRVYEFRPDEKIDWDKINKNLREKTYEVFTEHGLDARAFMSFNQTTSQAIWLVDNPKLLKELSVLFPRKVSTSFSSHKI